jgi:hypothetical protein
MKNRSGDSDPVEASLLFRESGSMDDLCRLKFARNALIVGLVPTPVRCMSVTDDENGYEENISTIADGLLNISGFCRHMDFVGISAGWAMKRLEDAQKAIIRRCEDIYSPYGDVDPSAGIREILLKT